MTDAITLIVHPSLEADIHASLARWRWYHEHRVKRWERRYQKPYPHPIVEIGEFNGLRFIEA